MIDIVMPEGKSCGAAARIPTRGLSGSGWKIRNLPYFLCSSGFANQKNVLKIKAIL
jgi:hypothetical protein